MEIVLIDTKSPKVEKEILMTGSMFKTGLNFEKYEHLCDIGVFV